MAAANWFGGVYKDDPSLFFPRFAIQAERFLDINPRYVIQPEEREAFLRERTACLVGVGSAKRFGWKIGDQVQLKGDIFPGEWTFVVRGIYTVARAADDDTQLLFHWEYLNERVKEMSPENADQAGWFASLIDSPNNAPRIAKDIDQIFENSSAESMTETEAAFQMGFVKMMGDIELILTVIGIAVFFAMLMVAMNTIMMSATERTTEVGVLKSMGFSGRTMVGLVLAESVTIALIGAIIGTVLSMGLTALIRPILANFVPTFYVSVGMQIFGIGVGIAIGLISGLIPAVRASRLHPVTALRSIH